MNAELPEYVARIQLYPDTTVSDYVRLVEILNRDGYSVERHHGAGDDEPELFVTEDRA